MTGKNFVGCEYSASGNRVFRTFDPVKNKENPTLFFEATPEEVDKAAQLAGDAFIELQAISHLKRADFLAEIASEIEALGDTLLHCYCSESGLSYDRAVSERARTIHQLRSFSELVKRNEWVEPSIDLADNDRIPVKPDLRKMLIGLGPVLVFGASNFPLAYSTAGGDTAAAFAAGCPVIVKSHPMHAGTGELVASAIVNAAQKTGMPQGIFSNLNAVGFEIGHQLVQHPKIKAVGFTGSVTGGRALFDLANKRPEPIPVFAEMGSTNPVVVLPDTLEGNKTKWSNNLISSITTGSGQFCTKPGLIFTIDCEATDRFIDEFTALIIQKEASSMLHPQIHEKFEKNKHNALQVGVGAVYEKEGSVNVNYGRQTLLVVDGNTFQENAALHEEVFGPFAIVVKCGDHSQLINCLSLLKGQLTGTILGSEKEIAKNGKVISILQNKVGRIIFNGVPTGVEVCPSMHHGGPYPASTDSRFTAVGIDSIRMFARPVVFQNCPDELLPLPLKNDNSLNIKRRVNGNWTNNSIIDKKW